MSRLDELLELERRVQQMIAIERMQLTEMGRIRDKAADAAVGYSLPTSITIETVAQACGITRAEILVPDRRPEVVRARHITAWLLHDQNLSYSAVGRVLERDHTTVRASCHRVDANPSLLAAARQIAERLALRSQRRLDQLAS